MSISKQVLLLPIDPKAPHFNKVFSVNNMEKVIKQTKIRQEEEKSCPLVSVTKLREERKKNKPVRIKHSFLKNNYMY